MDGYTLDTPQYEEKQQVNATQTALANVWLHCVCLVAFLKNMFFCFRCRLLFQQSTWAARLFLRHIGDKCIMRNQIMQLRANLEDKAVYLMPSSFCGVWIFINLKVRSQGSFNLSVYFKDIDLRFAHFIWWKSWECLAEYKTCSSHSMKSRKMYWHHDCEHEQHCQGVYSILQY